MHAARVRGWSVSVASVCCSSGIQALASDVTQRSGRDISGFWGRTFRVAGFEDCDRLWLRSMRFL